MSKNVLPVFSSKSLRYTVLKLRSLIHFEFIFVYGVRQRSNFIPLHVPYQFSQHHLLNRLSFLQCILYFLCCRETDHKYMTLFLGSLFCSTYSMHLFCASLILFWWPFLFGIGWSQETWFFQLSTSLQRLFWLLKVFIVSI